MTTPTPPLLTALYGPAAEEITSVSPRLQRWCEAFEAWTAGQHGPPAAERACHDWRTLFALHPCLPWQIDQAMLDHWLERLAEQRRSQSYIEHLCRCVPNFLRFCSQQPALAGDPFFAPSQPLPSIPQAPHPSPGGAYTRAYILRPAEARALLRAVDRQASLLGRRDYALLLMALMTGLHEHAVRCLQWKTVAQSLQPPNDAGEYLPAAVVEAILTYLRLSGRLDTMQPDDDVFAALAEPLRQVTKGSPAGAADWNATRPMCASQLSHLLKNYAAWAGLDTRRVNYLALRHTAAAVRLEAGDDPQALQRFLRISTLKRTQDYLRQVSLMLQRRGPAPYPWAVRRLHPPPSGPRPRRRGPRPGSANALKHGFYCRHWLPEDLADADPEQLRQAQIDDEIEATRLLMHRLVRLSCQPDSKSDPGKVLDLFTQSATRLAQMIQKRQELQASAQRNKLDTSLDQALQQVTAEMHLDELFGFPRKS